MPLPLIIGIGAAIAGAAGVGSGIHGAKKMKDANDTIKEAQYRHEKNTQKLEETNRRTLKKMDKLGQFELEIVRGFEEFSNTIEKIQNRPQFKEYQKDGVSLPKYDKEALEQVSVGAGVLLGGLGGAAAGTAGGFAAAGVTTSAVMALGTASTGTAISSLGGAAATNATLAALGGGSLAAGGGGIDLGTAVLGGATLGVGLLVGGIIFNVTGGKLSDKADEAYRQMEEAEAKMKKICTYLNKLKTAAGKYLSALEKVHEKYLECFQIVSETVNERQKIDWNEFSDTEKTATQNTVLLVGLLYKMCQVSLVEKAEGKKDMNRINKSEIDESIRNSEIVLEDIA